MQDYKVQVKWGEDILYNFVEGVQNQGSYEHLSQLLSIEMDAINEKH